MGWSGFCFSGSGDGTQGLTHSMEMFLMLVLGPHLGNVAMDNSMYHIKLQGV